MEQKKEYYAFISYKREDEKWAKWLQEKLEHYKFPTILNGRADLPKSIRPTFRDVTDLSPEPLEHAINNALGNSEWLIVVCSPRSAKSLWVCKEAQTFIDLGREDHIIPFVIEGNPFSNDTATECYPEALLNLTGSKELLAANINEMGRDAAAIKVIARMFNLRFDTLWQRHEREQRKRRRFVLSAILILLLVASSIAYWMWNKNIALLENKARYVSEKILELSKTDSYLAQLLAISIQEPDFPYTPEAEGALRSSLLSQRAIMKDTLKSIASAKFSPDNEQIASISEEGDVSLWDANTGVLLFRIADLSAIGDIAYSADSKLLAYINQNNEIKIWNAANGKLERIIGKPTEHISSLYFNSRGDRIIAASKDSIIFWDIKNRHIIKSIKFNGQIYSSKQNTHNNTLIVITSNTIQWLDSDNGDIIKTTELYVGEEYLSNCLISNDNKYIAVINGLSIDVYGVEDGKTICSFKGHVDHITSIGFSTKSNLLLSGSYGIINIWDIEGDSLVNSIEGHTNYVTSVCFSNDDRQILSASEDRTIRLWDYDQETAEQVLCDSSGFVWRAQLIPNSRNVVSSSEHDTIKIWNLDNHKAVREIIEGHGEFIYQFQLSADGKQLATIAKDNKIRLWDIESGILQKTLDVCSDWGKPFAYSPDGKLIATISDEQTIQLWNVKNGKVIKVLKGSSNAVMSTIFSPDGKQIATVSSDGTIKIWDVCNGNVLFTLLGDWGAFEYITYSPNGKFIAAITDSEVSSGTSIKVWNLEKHQIGHILYGHSDILRSVAFSPNSRYLISTSVDNTAKIWDVENEVLLMSLKHNDIVNHAEFSQDGTQFMTTCYDGKIRIWKFLPLRQLIDETRERFKNRQLTSEERKKYYLE